MGQVELWVCVPHSKINVIKNKYMVGDILLRWKANKCLKLYVDKFYGRTPKKVIQK
jgi:hypothetical protein